MCSQLCVLCQRPKKNFINFAKYHGVCEHENVNTQPFLKCIHCSATVPVLVKFENTQATDSFVEFKNKDIMIINYSSAVAPCEAINDDLHSISKDFSSINLPKVLKNNTKDLRNLEFNKKTMPKFTKSSHHPEVKAKFSTNFERTAALNLDDLPINVLDSERDINKIEESRPISPKSGSSLSLIKNESKCKLCNFFFMRRYCVLILIILTLFGLCAMGIYLA